MTEKTVTLRIVADSGKMVGEVNVAKGALRGLGDEGEKAAKGLDRVASSADRAESFVVRMGTAAGAAAAALATTLAVMVKTQIDAADAAGKMAARTGLSVEALSALQQAARSNSESLDAIPRLLDAIQTSAAKAAAGVRSQAADFKAMGISVRDTNTGALKPAEAILGEVTAKLATYRNGVAKTALENRLFGDSASALRLTLRQLGEDGLDLLKEKADAAGRLISGDTAEKAAKFNDELQRAKDRVIGVASEIGEALLPALIDGAAGFADMLDAAAKNETVRATLSAIWEAAKTGAGFVRELAGAFAEMANDPGLLQFLERTRWELEQIAKLVPDSIRDIKPGASTTVQWTMPEWLKAINGDTPGGVIFDRRAKLAAKEAADAASNNPFNIASTQQLVDLSRPLLDDLTKMWETVTGAVDDFGLHAKQVAKPDAPGVPVLPPRDSSAAKEAAENERILAQVQSEANKQVEAAFELNDRLSNGYSGPWARAQQEYAKQIDTIAQGMVGLTTQMNLGMITPEQYARGMQMLSDSAGVAADRLHKTQAAVGSADAVIATAMATLTSETAARGKSSAAINAENFARQIEQKLIRDGLPYQKSKIDALKAEAESIFSLNDILQQFGDTDPFLNLVDSVGKAEKALKNLKGPMGEALDPELAKKYENAIAAANMQIGVKMVGSYSALLGSVRAFTREGSKSYEQISAGMAALQIVQDALAMRAAIIAVLTQGEGEPYSAWARMAAMAAAVAPFLASIGQTLAGLGGGGGPSSQSAEVRQAQQGTGSVLGDSEAKSESILHATEITANATQQLVGLNRGMLDALRALQSGLGAAGNQLARGAGNAAFPGLQDNTGFPISSPLLDLHMADPISKAINGFLFGGSQEIIDQGIVVAGGALTDMLDKIVVGAYQTIEEDGGLFGSDKTFDNVTSVSDTFGRQFQLVIGSIIDTVRAGALAIGMLPADIQAALDAFQVAEIKISLKGLSAEEQQKEIEAVLSQLFDGLAGSVVPFIEQFQKVGEGLGETLIRIATEVQVVQEGFRQLGIAVTETDPEKFAQISDALIQAAGGLDAFIEGMKTFVSAFAPESYQFATNADALNSALTEAGLTLPATRAGMWDLMQSLDATTESGRAQIATLLRLADVSDAYYTALDKQTSEAVKLLDSMGIATGGLSEFGRSLVSIKAQEASAVDAANFLAKAHGREGASAMQLAAIHTWTAQQMAAAVRKLQTQIRDEVAKLYGGVPGSLDAINARIEELKQQASDIGSGWSDSINSAADASAQLFDQWRDGVKSVQDYLDSMLLGDLSGLTPEEQLAEAQRQLIAMQQAAAGGDAGALNQLPQLADAYLRLLRGSTASGEDYNAGFDWVRQLLQSVVDMPNPGTEGNGNGNTGGGGTTTVVASPELQALYDARDAALAAQEVEYRAQLAQQLTQHLSDLATALNVPIFELIAAQGVNLAKLATDLGVDLANLNAASIQALGGMATTLGVPLAELVQQLGLSMPDLKEGLVELTTKLGIDLTALTGTTAGQLAGLATSLGTNLKGLSEALGIDLGKLTDINSPIFQALEKNIGDLSPDIKTELTPLLDAVKNAAGDEQKNQAVKALRDHVDDMAPDIKNQLAPYFDDIMPVKALNQLDFLSQIHDIAADQLTELGGIRSNLAAANKAAGVESYAVGTGYVPNDGLAMIHQGEAIIPAPFAAWMRSNGIPVARGGAANDDSRVERAVNALREEVAALRRENSAGHRQTADTVNATGHKAFIQRDEIQRKNATGGRGQ